MSFMEKMKSARMIVISNRLPFVLKRQQDGSLERHSSAGGLVTAMAPVVKETNGLWVGWPGMMLGENDVIPEGNPEASNPAEQLLRNQFKSVNIDPDVFDDYYNGCCNATLWPLLHSMPDRAVFHRHYWKAYQEVNTLFADATFAAVQTQLGAVGEGDKGSDSAMPLVWIHDYQLMLVATHIRHKFDEIGILNGKVAFFLHIPFPSWDIFRLLPWDDEVLIGLLGCDLIGFHVEGYADNFLECCQKRLGLRIDRERRLVEHEGRTVRVQAFPIGIPYQQFQEMSQQASVPTTVDPNVRLVLGVDRLDYTKGIIHRVRAFEKLLQSYPEHIGNVVLLQIAVPSRTDVEEYKELKDELDREVGRINGHYSTAAWSPIRYIYRMMKQSELCAFYRDAYVALVTPIRDGMNLVAKEFVACQIKEPGVLILSPFTGAGETMNEALICNPLEEYNLADCIHRALKMPLDERELRMSALQRRERIHDVHHWVQTFLQATGAFNGDHTEQFEPLTIAHFQKWLSAYVGDKNKLALLLDYDGTLAPIVSHPDNAQLPDQTRKVLETLAHMPDVYIGVISGRSVHSVKAMVGIDAITYAGNHGLDIEHPDGTKFVHPEQAKFHALISELTTELEEAVCKEGAWIESKGVLLTYHYRLVPPEFRPALMDKATAIILRHGFMPCKAHCAIEARPPIEWDKGRASIHVLRTTFGVDWSERVRIIYAGDDVTDEDAMTALKGMAVTFRVAGPGTARTVATHRLHNTDSVLTMLKWVEQHMKERQERKQNTVENGPPSVHMPSGY